MKEIYLSEIDDDFEPDSDILISASCLVSKVCKYEKIKEYQFVPFPFKEAKEIESASRIVSENTEYEIRRLAPLLNARNDTEHSLTFWRILLTPWLNYILTSLLEKESRVKQLLSRYKHQNYKIRLLKINSNWKFQQTSDIWSAGSRFHHWLYSEIISKSIPRAWLVEVEQAELLDDVNPVQASDFKSKLKNWLRRSCRFSGAKGTNWIENITFSMLLSAKRRCINSPPATEQPLPVRHDWIFDIDSTIEKTLPRSLVNLRCYDYLSIRPKSGKLNILCHGIRHDELQQARLAWRAENGEKLVGSQHGGGYGTLSKVQHFEETEYKLDQFITWGWTQNKTNAVPLPSPYLSKIQDKHSESTQDILLIGTFASAYTFRIATETHDEESLAYLEDRIQFLKELNPGIYNKIKHRPYPKNNYSFDDKTFVEERFPDIKLSHGPLPSQLLQCKAAVIDHPGTSLHECTASNTPFIAFWKKESFCLCDDVKSIFEQLSLAKVFHDNPIQAAHHLNKVASDINEWWKNRDTVLAVAEFRKYHALTSRHWHYHWLRHIFKLN